MSAERQAPDWPPHGSAIGLIDGERRYGSTGQLFEVRLGRWERVRVFEPSDYVAPDTDAA